MPRRFLRVVNLSSALSEHNMSARYELDALTLESSRGNRTQAGAPSPTASRFDLEVGIIYSGERHYMTPLVSSLAGSATGITVRLILVDNASADGVTEWRGRCRRPRSSAMRNRSVTRPT